MEPFCQFFATPHDVVRAYIALESPRLRDIAEERMGCPIIRLEDFFSEELNLFFWKDVCIMRYKDHLYLYDEGRNYMKLRKLPSNLGLEEVYIQDIAGYNRLWDILNRVFAEVCAGDTAIEKGSCKANLWLGNAWAFVDVNATGIYDGKCFHVVNG